MHAACSFYEGRHSVELVIFTTLSTLIVKDSNTFREIHKYQYEIDHLLILETQLVTTLTYN